ncbi:MAG: hypothetical protein COA43_00725 [Robiginitomaculum sp.]|nr:MAG: hypothetical protein COA43_00725 [Robiginitomaculum sp.]
MTGITFMDIDTDTTSFTSGNARYDAVFYEDAFNEANDNDPKFENVDGGGISGYIMWPAFIMFMILLSISIF